MEFLSHGEETTWRLGELVGRLAQPGDVVTLSGDLGAGKTRFSQGMARGVGVDPSVPITSPTFTLLNEYLGRIPFFHLDLYRLASGDIADLGIEEYLYGNGLAVIEWAERLGAEVPAERLDVVIAVVDENRRLLRFSAFGLRHEELLRALFSAAKNL